MQSIAGIDLGTTNSCIAVWTGKRAVLIPDEYGNPIMPSAIHFSEDGRSVAGHAALKELKSDPLNTVTDIKRIIGKSYNEVIDIAQRLPFKITRGTNDLALVKVHSAEYTPEYISGLILKELIGRATTYVGNAIDKVVVGVPAYFTSRQRLATAEAIRSAGVKVARLVAEPNLAALYYGVGREKDEKIVVFDLGGGTFDVSILRVGDGVYEVIAVNGDNFLGGGDFDKALFEWLINEIRAETGRAPSSDPLVRQFLLDATVTAKCALSEVSDTPISLQFIQDSFGASLSFETFLSRDKLGQVCEDLFQRLEKPCEEALADAHLTPHEIDRILLVGGATRMPQIATFVQRFFGKSPSRAVNPDEAVCGGAAIQAGVLTGSVKDVLLLDIVPISLGVAAADGTCVKIISRNTTIPTRKSALFSTVLDEQSAVEIRVIEGEREQAFENRTLGRLILDGIKLAPAGTADLEITFEIDANGLLTVLAHDLAGSETRSLILRPF